MDPNMAETFEYLLAYHECTVPDQTVFNNVAELDNEIIRQLAASNLNMIVVPDMAAKVHRIAARVRNTWTAKYGLTFSVAPQPANFAGGNIPPTPLFDDGQEFKLTHFEVYTSFDKIYTTEKREMVEKVLTTLANESISRCMEAVFRNDDDVDEAVAWLRQNAV